MSTPDLTPVLMPFSTHLMPFSTHLDQNHFFMMEMVTWNIPLSNGKTENSLLGVWFWGSVSHFRSQPFVTGSYAFRFSQCLLFCLSEDKQYTVLKLEIFYVIYFLGTCPTQTTTVLIYIYIFAHDFKCENGMNSTKMLPTRTSLAAESAAKVPPMPTRPGTQINTVFLPLLVRFIQSSKICTKIGWSYLVLKIACKDESGSDNITNDLPLEQ